MRIRLEMKYWNGEAIVKIGHYGNRETAIQLWSETEGPIATATVNLEDYDEHPSPGCVFIYGNYSEHVGIQKALEDAKVIGPVKRTVKYGKGDAHAFECELLVSVLHYN